ncbi:MAG: hypothetical protein IAG13_33700 [Deltaproteobacteria bacterium]|nr:hypothetical protein [Nannocystaceae bacterium]
MRVRDMLDASALALPVMLLIGCFPPVDPDWLEREPELLALRIEVDEPGPLGDLVAPVPIDRQRVEALPGDRIRFEPWVLAPEGVQDGTDIDAVYFTCDPEGDCFTALASDAAMEACDPAAPALPCMIGRGADVRYVLPGIEALALVGPLLLQVLVVAGQPDVRDTDDCIDELQRDPYRDLHGCMLLTRTIPIGPNWLLSVALGDPSAIEELPPEVLLQWPNFNPEVGEISGAIDNRPFSAHAGDRLQVGVGQRVRMSVVPDPRDAQQYAVGVVGETVTRVSEGLSTDWYANGQVDTTTDYWEEAPILTWSSRVEGAVRFDVLLSDRIGGLGWGSITFEVGPASAPG